MGPQAWFAIGRALSVAVANCLFTSNNGVIALIAKQINKAIVENELETARIILKDFAWRYQKEYNDFKQKYKNDLPAELFIEK